MVTFVTQGNRMNVLDNLILVVLKEMVGLGPQFYCIICSCNFDFGLFLMLTLHYLPKEKFSMYPEEETLRGPFLYTPWDTIGRMICGRPSISIDCYLAYLADRARAILPL